MNTGELLLSNIGGLNSIMNLVSLCFYNSIITDDDSLKIIMKDIFYDEIEHLETLSHYVYHLGLDPRFWAIEDDRYEYWSPSYNIYSKQEKSLIHNTIKQINDMINIYEQQIKTIKNKEITLILEKIIKEEKEEIGRLRSF